MITVVDIGNSAAKVCNLSQEGWPLALTVVSLASFGVWDQTAFTNLGKVTIMAWSGESDLGLSFCEKLKTAGKTVLTIDASGSVPFISRYAPGQAGVDRLANVAAAIEQVSGPAVVIDAGSAITMEVIGPELQFMGGAIFPGTRLQTMALHSGTARLPHVSVDLLMDVVGRDTESAIRSGIAQACAGGTERLIKMAVAQPGMAKASILITGGDGAWLASLLHCYSVSVVPTLTVRGLYLLARHQFPAAFLLP